MRILNVNFSIDLNVGTGTAERNFQLSRFLAKAGHACKTLTMDDGASTAARIKVLGADNVVMLPCLWRRFGVPAFRWKTISRLVEEAQVVHLMGHWSVLNALVYVAARRQGKPYVVCPAGALLIMGRSKTIKRVYNWLVGNALVRNAAGWVAITDAEVLQFEIYGVEPTKVTIIPNGVAREDFPQNVESAYLVGQGLVGVPMILFMGRLAPIKGPDLLLAAFISIADQLEDYHVVFAGPDGGMLADLKEAAARAGLQDRVHFMGYAGGDEKVAVYRAAKLLAVPSRLEAMSLVTLEAGICGTPALMTDQCGFSEIKQVDSRLEVGANAQSFADGLRELLADKWVLDDIAPKYRHFVETNYTWDVVASAYGRLYDRVLASAVPGNKG